MLLRGRQVELVTTKDEVLLDRPDDFWILTDRHGEMFPPCHVLLCRCEIASGAVSKLCDPDDLAEARSYYDRRRFRAWRPVFSMGPWRLVALVSEIRYLRDRPPPFRHPFESPVRCYVSTVEPITYKLTLPEGCILNNHGFVEP